MDKNISCIEALKRQLIREAEANSRIVALSADLQRSCGLADFRERFPDRTFECGIAEQNMVGMAAGLAAVDMIPVAASYAIFLVGRAWEQIRNCVCLGNSNVKLIGTHSGLYNTADGPSHTMCEDIALARSIPGMVVLSPCDATETARALSWALAHQGPVYLRLWGGAPVPVVHPEDYHFRFGEPVVVYTDPHTRNSHIGLVATGAMVPRAIEAARALSDRGSPATVVDVPTLAPFNGTALKTIVMQADFLFVLEEHASAGGLGSAVCESVAEERNGPSVIRLGIDRWVPPGKREERIADFGLTPERILQRVQEAMARNS